MGLFTSVGVVRHIKISTSNMFEYTRRQSLTLSQTSTSVLCIIHEVVFLRTFEGIFKSSWCVSEVLMRDQALVFEGIEGFDETLVRVFVPRPSEMPGFANAQGCAPRPTKDPVLEGPCAKVKSCLGRR